MNGTHTSKKSRSKGKPHIYMDRSNSFFDFKLGDDGLIMYDRLDEAAYKFCVAMDNKQPKALL